MDNILNHINGSSFGRTVVLPNELRDEINALLDEQFLIYPDAEKDREVFFSMLLAFFDEHGYLPDFKLSQK